MLYWICLTFTWFCGITFSGTQRVISFLRQMMEHGGFYRTSDQAWVQFERIQFVGACNPPTDPGRKPLTHRYNAVLDQPGSLCMSFNNLICLACCNIQSLWEVYWSQCDQPASSCNLQRRRWECTTLDLSYFSATWCRFCVLCPSSCRSSHVVSTSCWVLIIHISSLNAIGFETKKWKVALVTIHSVGVYTKLLVNLLIPLIQMQCSCNFFFGGGGGWGQERCTKCLLELTVKWGKTLGQPFSFLAYCELAQAASKLSFCRNRKLGMALQVLVPLCSICASFAQTFFLLCQIPASRACGVRGLPRWGVPEADLRHFQPCHAEAGAFTETLRRPTHQCHGGVLHDVPGEGHTRCSPC